MAAAKKKEKKPIMSGASSWHTRKFYQSILLRCLWLSVVLLSVVMLNVVVPRRQVGVFNFGIF